MHRNVKQLCTFVLEIVQGSLSLMMLFDVCTLKKSHETGQDVFMNNFSGYRINPYNAPSHQLHLIKKNLNPDSPTGESGVSFITSDL